MLISDSQPIDFIMVPGAGIEPARHLVPRDFKSLASTISATQAMMELS